MANEKLTDQIHKYFKSFSGVDALAFLLFPESSPVLIGTLTTISYSIFREKVPVKLMSRVSVPVYTKGLRYCAGTMIFTMINKHWVNELIAQVPWLKYYGKIKADELPNFDIMIVCANEYGASASMYIYAAEISDESQTLSIEDIFTENQFSFVAKDIDVMDSDDTGNIVIPGRSTSFIQPIESIVSLDMVAPTEGQINSQKQSATKRNDELTIYVDSVKVDIPAEEKERPRINEHGNAIAPMRFVFNAMGWNVQWIRPEDNGGISKGVFYLMAQDGDPQFTLEINHNNKTGVFYKRDLNTNKTTKYNIPFSTPPFVEYGRTVCELRPLFDFLSNHIGAYTVTWGYDSNSVFIDSQSVKNKPTLDENSNSKDNIDEIQNLQSLLNDNGYRPTLNISGVFDYTTKWALMTFQANAGLEPTGICDKATWAALLKHTKINNDTWPKTGKCITASGAYMRKEPKIDDKNILTTILYKSSVKVYSHGSGGWVPVITTVRGVELKGFMEAKDLKF
jgi:hypothetical protein